MCDPVTIGVTTALVGASSAALGFAGQQQQYKSNAQMANMQAAQTYNSLGEQSSQIDAQQSENTVNAMIERAKGEGAISAYAGAFGLGGATTARETNAVDFSAGRKLSLEDLTSQNERLQNQSEVIGTDLQRQSKINSVAQADPLGLVLGVAKAGLSGVGAYTGSGGTFGSAAKKAG